MATALDTYITRVAAFIQERHGDAFLIPFNAAARLAGESYGTWRNRLSAGTLSVPVVQRDGRNFVAVPDLVDYIAGLWAGSTARATAVATADVLSIGHEPEKRGPGRPPKNPQARAKALRAKEARRARKAAHAEQQGAEGCAA